MSEVIIGVDLGGTNVKTAIVSRDKKVLAKDSRPTNAEGGPEAVMNVMEQSVRELTASQGINLKDVLAVGFGAPGPMNWQTGIVYSPPNLPGWTNVPLAKLMKKRLGVRCFVDNDANVACYGEYWLGAGQGTENMAVLTLGTGVGGGVVVFGKLLRGIDGTAAELGHLKVQRDGRMCGCGSRGCLEAYASVTGMVRTAKEGFEQGKESSLKTLCGGNLDKITGRMIYEAAKEGDAFAQWVFNETATWLGLGIASIVNFLNPEKVVLCGGMIAAGDMLFNPVRETMLANTFEVPGKRCQIVPAGLGEDSGVIGCAGCALARYQAE
ncbi:MAG TPA: ROK family glucokinase [Candidatus Hydrogenedentes bacterium]|nr:ROK family glucokinase [Candidatus Hydrogenedentota bacterium]